MCAFDIKIVVLCFCLIFMLFYHCTTVVFGVDKVYQFLGILFAEPPLNELRFQKPVPKKPWNAVLSVNKWGSACMQPVFPGFNTELHLSEDCLILNKNKLRPGMVWIHGGGFNCGSANTASQSDGTPITGLKAVIIVSINYLSPHLVSLPSQGLFNNAIMPDDSINAINRCTKPALPTVDGEFLPNYPEELVSNHTVDSNANVYMVTFHPLNPINLTIPHAKYIISKLFVKKLIDFYSERYLASLPADDSDAIRLAVAQALGDTIPICSTYAFGRDLIMDIQTKIGLYIYIHHFIYFNIPYFIFSFQIVSLHKSLTENGCPRT
uniref:Carboxylesterase type B domain-containing protein n=1 Tax=Tetranychus urticae TaxID=32264 RepID=T1L025_TETUR